jgi:hypothetical protein
MALAMAFTQEEVSLPNFLTGTDREKFTEILFIQNLHLIEQPVNSPSSSSLPLGEKDRVRGNWSRSVRNCPENSFLKSLPTSLYEREE